MGAAVKSKGFSRPLKFKPQPFGCTISLRLQRRSCALSRGGQAGSFSSTLRGEDGLALFELIREPCDDTLRAVGAAFAPFNGSTSSPKFVVLSPDSNRIGTVHRRLYNGEGYQR